MIRCGNGYDAHRLAAGRKLILGGVEIPHERGLDGHSDADVLCHAIADALLGAIAEGDIGHHFPNTDESIRGISSLEILEKVSALLEAKKARVVNVDAALWIEPSCVSIKATTNEGLGAIGRGEGMAAMAVATVEME